MDVRAATPAGWARYASGGTWRPAPHLLLINEVLLAAAAGEKWASRVIIQAPPRHGKSEEVSGYFPSWYLGMYPDRKLILASYEANLASLWGQRNRDLLEAYGPDVFGVKVRQDSQAKHDWKFHHRKGGMFTTGIGGALTGRGAHIAIIDDPVKNAAQALSPTYRARAKEWYKSTLRTRLEPDGAVIVIQTRWHEDDLAGWLQTEGDEDWLVIDLPAIAEEDESITLPGYDRPSWERKAGEVLWPWRFSLEDLIATQTALGGPDGHWWTAMYQQRPTPIGGGILKPEQFRRFRVMEDGYLLDTPAGPRLVSVNQLRKFATADLATSVKTQADYTVFGICGLAWPDLLLLDVLRRKMEGPDIPRIAARVDETYRPAYWAVESVGFQTSTVQDMRRGDPSAHPPRKALPVKALLPQGDKVSRALTLAARMAGGHIYIPEHSPWEAALTSELALFPNGAHDDQVDMLSYAALEAQAFGDNFLHTE